MANVVVVGTQWGDEGKGKIVDWLSARADVVVRFQGGHNAGHTLVIDRKIYKLSLLPSGIVRKNKMAIIGNGVVVDPWALVEEIEKLKKQGVEISRQNFRIADNAPLILPLHKELDLIREEKAGKQKIGTTGRGIGPAYEDKVGRRAIRMTDLLNPQNLQPKIERLLTHHNALRIGLGQSTIKEKDIFQQLREIAPKITPYIDSVWNMLDSAKRTGKRILFEGAQGILLDVDHGTYPFVTSSNTVAAQAAIGAGIGTGAINYVLGIIKAYTTRVGSGPFPTEQNNQIGEKLGTRGKEFGTVTGRQRRCGWFDAVLVRQAVKTGGIQGLALTKLDVLDGLDEIKICTKYRVNGEEYPYMPPKQNADIEPIYETIEGWKHSTEGAKSWNELPAQAVKYVRRIEELTQCHITLVSTSPEREDVILMKDPFED